MPNDSFDDESALMSRLGLDEEQFDKVTAFTAIMTGDCDVEDAADLYDASADDVEDKRYAVVKMLHLADQLMDENMVESEGILRPRLIKDEDGTCSVGEFSNYKLGRAVLGSFDGSMTVKECGEQWGFSEEVVGFGQALYTQILLYLGAEAIKASPYLTTLGIFDRVSNAEDFVHLRDIVETYLKEDDETLDTESDAESDTESEFDLGIDDDEI